MGDPVFVLDANVFIEAKRRYYAFDLGTKFWESLVHLAANGRVESIDRVKEELLKGKGDPNKRDELDELAVWAEGHFAEAFASTDEEDVVRSYGDVMNWVNGQAQFFDAAKADFARGADGWLVAYARAKGRVLVTHEVEKPEARSRIPISNVCKAFNVRFVDTFQMLRELRELGVRWTL